MSGVFLCCNIDKDEEFIGRDQPQRPAPFGFDVNDDGIDDISFFYRSGPWDGAGISGGYIALEIIPTQENDVLIRRDGEDYPLVLFSKLNDTIFKSVSQPREWVKEISKFPLSIYGNSQNRWPFEWSVEKGNVLNPYYLGIKIKANDNSQLGWLKLKIDGNSGNIEILDHQLGSEDYLLIDR